jgi:hypothetical protein
MSGELNVSDQLFSEIQTLVTEAKQQAAITVNTSLTMMYWQIGQRIWPWVF